MNLTEQQLKDIEDLAGLFLTSDEIAVLLDLDIHLFMNEIASRKGPAFKAYFLGKTKSKKQIRENVIKMARHGSPQAEELADAYIESQKQFERKHYVRT